MYGDKELSVIVNDKLSLQYTMKDAIDCSSLTNELSISDIDECKNSNKKVGHILYLNMNNFNQKQ